MTGFLILKYLLTSILFIGWLISLICSIYHKGEIERLRVLIADLNAKKAHQRMGPRDPKDADYSEVGDTWINYETNTLFYRKAVWAKVGE